MMLTKSAIWGVAVYYVHNLFKILKTSSLNAAATEPFFGFGTISTFSLLFSDDF
jgi:hypothetical protein